MWLFIYYLINRAKSDPVLSLPKFFILIVNHTCDKVVSFNSILTSIFPFCLGTIIVPRLMGATWTLLPAATLANSSPRSTWRKTLTCRFAILIWKNHSSTHLLNFKTIPVPYLYESTWDGTGNYRTGIYCSGEKLYGSVFQFSTALCTTDLTVPYAYNFTKHNCIIL